MPEGWRLDKAFSVLGPAGAWWLQPRIEGQVELRLRRLLRSVDGDGDGLRLGLQGPEGSEELTTAQIIACTGYRPSLGGLGFLDEELRSQLRTVGGAPLLDRGFQGSVPDLYFVGFLASPSFGPLMRFVFGARFAARRLAGRLVASGRR